VHIKINISSDVSFYKMNLPELLVLQQFYLTDNDKKLNFPRYVYSRPNIPQSTKFIEKCGI